MSYHKILLVPVLPYSVRDYYLIDEGAGAFNTDLWYSYGVVGLDWFVFNDGAGPLTVTLDGEITVTIPAGGGLGMDNTKYAIIAVTAVQHRLIIAGVRKNQSGGAKQ